MEQTFLESPNVDTIIKLFDSTQEKERQALSVAVDATLVNNIEAEGENLAEIMIRLQNSLIVYIVVGILQMSSVLFLIWRPLYAKITANYLNCRRVYSVLPVYLIADNKQILRVLKLQNDSKVC